MTLEKFTHQYEARTPTSKALFQEARQVLPGGVAGNGKYMSPYPLYIEQANGSMLRDVDGNEYIDLLMGAGVHILGHSPPQVIEVVQTQILKGVQLYLPAQPEIRLAQKLNQLMPHVEMVRFVNSGTEATMMALRAARAFRNRDKVARFEGNYHGQHDYALVSTMSTGGSPDAPIPVVDSAGIPHSVLKDLIVLPYNNNARVASILEKHAEELAAVIIEPVSAFGLGSIPADPGFLQQLREICSETGILLIFDEVVTNLRLGLGGAAEYFGVKPDLVAMGKIISGGFAAAAYGGKAEIMDQVLSPVDGRWDLTEKMFQSGSFSGNPVSMLAGLTVLEELERGEALPYLDQLSAVLRSGLHELAQESELDMLITGVKSIFQIHFGVPEIRNKRESVRADQVMAHEFHMGLIAYGIAASAHPLFLSTAHTEEDVERILEVSRTVLEEMARG
jgi:glutamate-1-semialdehyde 2,1-aminomutase